MKQATAAQLQLHSLGDRQRWSSCGKKPYASCAVTTVDAFGSYAAHHPLTAELLLILQHLIEAFPASITVKSPGPPWKPWPPMFIFGNDGAIVLRRQATRQCMCFAKRNWQRRVEGAFFCLRSDCAPSFFCASDSDADGVARHGREHTPPSF